MSDYRRNRVPGGTYFFTVNLNDRSSDLLVTQIERLRNAVRKTTAKLPFYIDAWAILPDHMHCIWTLPEGDTDYSGRWWSIKSGFARSIGEPGNRSPSTIRRGERGIWQRRFWEHTIRDDRDYAAHMDYTHFNPVKHGYTASPGDWPYSTFRRCVAKGIYPESWIGGDIDLSDAGERGMG